MARRPTVMEPYEKFSVRLPVSLKRQVEEYARKKNTSFTWELQRAVQRGMSEVALAREGLALVIGREDPDDLVDAQEQIVIGDDDQNGMVIPLLPDTTPELYPAGAPSATRMVPCEHRVAVGVFCPACD